MNKNVFQITYINSNSCTNVYLGVKSVSGQKHKFLLIKGLAFLAFPVPFMM